MTDYIKDLYTDIFVGPKCCGQKPPCFGHNFKIMQQGFLPHHHYLPNDTMKSDIY